MQGENNSTIAIAVTFQKLGSTLRSPLLSPWSGELCRMTMVMIKAFSDSHPKEIERLTIFPLIVDSSRNAAVI